MVIPTPPLPHTHTLQISTTPPLTCQWLRDDSFMEMFEHGLIGTNKIKWSLGQPETLEICRATAIGFGLELSSRRLGRLPGLLLMQSLHREALAKRKTDSQRKWQHFSNLSLLNVNKNWCLYDRNRHAGLKLSNASWSKVGISWDSIILDFYYKVNGSGHIGTGYSLVYLWKLM